MPLTTQAVTKWSEGVATQLSDLPISNVVIDSRKVKEGSLFVALKGEQVDGHNYLESAYNQGAIAALVEKSIESDLAQIKVANTNEAMPKIATAYRSQLNARVAAVTGSCGKTTTKQMLLSILQKAGRVSATEGNQNNELGVPLTLLNASEEDDYLIVEMGAAQQGDIAHLMSIANPDVVAITNAQEAHVGRFGSLQNIVEAKGEIYNGAKDDAVLVVNADDAAKDFWLKAVKPQQKVLLFSAENINSSNTDVGADASADVFACDVEAENAQVSFTLNYLSNSNKVKLPILGKHNISNALCAATMAFALDVSFENVIDGLQSFTQVSGRGQILQGVNQAKIIDDSYNANPSSVKASADMLEAFENEKVLVIGEMAELGDFKTDLYKEVSQYLASKKIDHIFTVGSDIKQVSKPLENGKHFAEQDELVSYLKESMNAETVVLFKASRSVHFENMVKQLLQEQEQ